MQELLLDADRQGTPKLLLDHLALTPVNRAAGGFPRVVRRARPIGAVVGLNARIASDLLGALRVVEQIRVVGPLPHRGWGVQRS